MYTYPNLYILKNIYIFFMTNSENSDIHDISLLSGGMNELFFFFPK